MEGDPELIDDSEFYQQLLKEFLESCDTGASGQLNFSITALAVATYLFTQVCMFTHTKKLRNL